jgi:hypothetical protein
VIRICFQRKLCCLNPLNLTDVSLSEMHCFSPVVSGFSRLVWMAETPTKALLDFFIYGF